MAAEKLTLADLTPLRTYIVTVQPGKGVEVIAHHAQVRPDGSLEMFQTVRNHISTVALFAPGIWMNVRAEAPSQDVMRAIEALESEALAKLAVQRLANHFPEDKDMSGYSRN